MIEKGRWHAPADRKQFCLCQAFLLILAFFFLPGLKAYAAFPPDMARKPVKTIPLDEAAFMDIPCYSSPDLSAGHLKETLDGTDLTLSATKVKQDAIYGNYKSGGQKGKGWFPIDYFVQEPDYQDEYFTVRDAMTVYSDSDLTDKKTTIKKYSGVIVIGQGSDSSQVIYDKGKYYGIGWMSNDTLTNTLIYDGRDKQTMANGTYLFRCGYQDDEKGGAAIGKQPELSAYKSRQWEIRYVSDNSYYLKDPQTEEYLTVSTHDGGLSWDLVWKPEPDERHSLVQLERMTGAYTIKNVSSQLYLAQDKEDELFLQRYRYGNAGTWRLSAMNTIVDKKQPMVFTQYDPKWCGTAYGSEGCMGTAGCGILATVNAVYALSGNYMDVMELADYAVEKHYRIIGSGTDEGIFKAACKKYGRKYNFKWDGHGTSLKQLRKKLAAGDTAAVHVQGHYVAVVAYDKETDRYLMLDSNYLPKREDTAFGDWISPGRLLEGTLEAQQFYYFKLRDPVY